MKNVSLASRLFGSILLVVFLSAFARPLGSISGNDGPKEPAAYYLTGGDAADIAPATVEVVQKDKAFAPGFAAVQQGGTVAFPNQDELMHNVYSAKGSVGFFDMGSAEKTLADKSNLLSKMLDKAGVVEISCAIHPVMQGLVFVVPSKYFTTSSDGSYSFDGVPSGTYDVMVMTKSSPASKLKSITVN